MKPDLFYRLAVVYIHLPRLAERGDDMRLLADRFISYFNEHTKSHIGFLGDDIVDIFRNYSWPGNVRELRNVIEGVFAFASGGNIQIGDIPKYIVDAASNQGKRAKINNTGEADGNLLEKVNGLEEKIILQAYNGNCGNMNETAQQLGISRQLLRYKLKKYDEKEI